MSALAKRVNIKNKGSSKAEQDEIMNATNETIASIERSGVH